MPVDRSRLPDLPRIPILDGPTPLQRLPRLSAALDDRADLWIKREDAGLISFAGNKLRNLELLLAEALANGADTLVTSGRRWSNHCRLTAATGARLGLEVHLVLTGPAAEDAPNVGLIREFGGTVHWTRTLDRAERDAIVEGLVEELRARGRRVAAIPVGGSGAVGAWGQVLAGLEALDQAEEAGFVPDVIVLPSASGGTQAGLTVAAALAGVPTGIVGMVVGRPMDELRPVVERLTGELATLAGIAAPLDRLQMDVSQLGPGYGVPTDASADGARLLARTEGILLDPVYTAKALAGLVAMVRAGVLDGRSAIFWHGGGLPSIFEVLGGTA